MHALLVTLGTDGDVLPHLGLGMRLRERGHRVTLCAPASFEKVAEEQGLQFATLVTQEEMDELLSFEHFWHPIKTGKHTAHWGRRMIRRQYHLLADLAAPSDTILVTNPGVFAGRLVQETMGKPNASLFLQPGLVPSNTAPPITPVGFGLPRIIAPLYWRLLDATGYWLAGRKLNEVRTELGLQPVRRMFQWWFSPDLVIGLFPEWYASKQPDWPRQVRLAGFPNFDGHGPSSIAPDLLEFCHAGDPPVAFTFGTGMMHGKDLFVAALEACQRLNVRGLFLTKYGDRLQTELPSTVRIVHYAPLGQLLPHCAAIVHHGGIGTVARALQTATPQLVLPMAFDQPDNAHRVQRMGAGKWFRSRRRTGARVAQALAEVLAPAMRERCRAVAAWFSKEDAFQVAAGWLEELADGILSKDIK